MNNRTIIASLLAAFGCWSKPVIPGIRRDFHVRTSNAGNKGSSPFGGRYVNIATISTPKGELPGAIDHRIARQTIHDVDYKVHDGTTAKCASARRLVDHQRLAFGLAQEEWTNALVETTFGLELHPLGGIA